MPTVAERFVDTLAAAGIDTVFGLPGGEVVEILDALRRRNLRFVFVHNESSAVFMADAMARLTGKPGVVLTTLGPGATNAVAGVAHAYLDRSPVLVVTAQKPDALLPDYTHQVLDLHALYRPITKGTFKVTAHNVQSVTQQALALAQAGRPGPIHLQLSNEEAALPSREEQEPGAAEAATIVAEDAQTPITKVAQARQLLATARKPVIVAGLGLEPEQPYAALAELAEAASAPVIVLPKSKGAIPDDHPLATGVIGLTRTDPAYEILDEADCIVAVGLDVVELVKKWDQAAPLIWIAPWANVDPVLPAQIEFVGAMEPILQQLADSQFGTATTWGANRVAAFHAKVAQAPLPEPAAGRLLPQQVLAMLRQQLPRESLLAVDVGSHKIHSSLAWPTYMANRFLVSNGLSCMGFALPSAIGASFALGGQPTVCLTGDAGMAMVMGELGVLAQWQLPVIVIVLNDSAIDLIRSHQVRAGKPIYGTEFPSPNFAQIATAYGLAATRVRNETEYTVALATALTSGRPMVIEVMLDPVSYPTTPR
ncbi:MAG: thiamine pyrophosphate-binding protein [Caldilineaceae bacterium]|nr:thiamine pyrophosphate-binding protein [Caldilineaceae bacterium]